MLRETPDRIAKNRDAARELRRFAAGTALSHFWDTRIGPLRERMCVAGAKTPARRVVCDQVRPLHPRVFPANEATKMRTLKTIAFAALAAVSVAALAAAPV